MVACEYTMLGDPLCLSALVDANTADLRIPSPSLGSSFEPLLKTANVRKEASTTEHLHLFPQHDKNVVCRFPDDRKNFQIEAESQEQALLQTIGGESVIPQDPTRAHEWLHSQQILDENQKKMLATVQSLIDLVMFIHVTQLLFARLKVVSYETTYVCDMYR